MLDQSITIPFPSTIILVDPLTGEPMNVRDEAGAVAPFAPFVFREVALRVWANSKDAGIDDMTKLHAWQGMIGALKAAGETETVTISKEAHALLCPVVEAWLMAAAKDMSPMIAGQLLPIANAVLKAA